MDRIGSIAPWNASVFTAVAEAIIRASRFERVSALQAFFQSDVNGFHIFSPF